MAIDAAAFEVSPREQLLNRGAGLYRLGAILNGVLIVLVLFLSALGGRQMLANLHPVLLAQYSGGDDMAAAAALLLLLINTGALLVLMIGTLAQEFWTLAGAIVLALLNLGAALAFGFYPAVLTLLFSIWASAVLIRDRSAFRVNPVSLKELRGRMRGIRAFIIISVYLGLMSGFTILLYLVQTQVDVTSGTAITGELGRILFFGVVGIELLLIIFIAPAFTAGAITGERERKTYDLLQTTLLPAASFIVGKLESAMSYILLLLLAAIPLQSIAFLFGGVSEMELVLAFFILTITAIALGAVGLFFSSVTDRTLTASVRSYTTALVITFAVPILLGVFLGVYDSSLRGVNSNIANNPFTEGLFIYIGLIAASLNPITAAIYSQRMLVDHQQIAFHMVTLNDGSQIPVISPWILFSAIYVIVSAVLLLFAVRGLRRVIE